MFKVLLLLVLLSVTVTTASKDNVGIRVMIKNPSKKLCTEADADAFRTAILPVVEGVIGSNGSGSQRELNEQRELANCNSICKNTAKGYCWVVNAKCQGYRKNRHYERELVQYEDDCLEVEMAAFDGDEIETCKIERDIVEMTLSDYLLNGIDGVTTECMETYKENKISLACVKLTE